MEIPKSIINKILDNIYENLLKSATKAAAKRIHSADIFHRNREAYFESLVAQYGYVRILGMSKPMPTEKLYIPVQVTEDTHGRAYVNSQYIEYINENQKVPDAIRKELNRIVRADAEDAVDVIESGSFFILLAGPGGGKTTLLRYLALAYCGRIEHETAARITPLFPIFISLRDVEDRDRSLIELFREQLAVAKFPEPKLFLESLLEKGKCIILVDGLDEVPSGYQEKISRQLKFFSTKFHRNKVVISSRITEPLRELESYTEIQLCHFTMRQVRGFTDTWFAGKNERKGRQLSDQISKDMHLRELASTPLLLTLICILYKHDLRIPTNRGELYERCVECLLREWDASRGFRRDTKFDRFSDARKIQFFSGIASTFFRENKLLFSEEDVLVSLGSFLDDLSIPRSKTEEVLNELISHHGLIVERAPKVYSFSHLTFQEYFVAKHVLMSGGWGNSLNGKVSDPRWKEVICLSASTALDCTEIVSSVISSIDWGKIKLISARGALGYEVMLLRDLVLSELSLSRKVREKLYECYLAQHLTVYPVLWEHIEFSWRYSNKADKVMIRFDLEGLGEKKQKLIAGNLANFKWLIETLSGSFPLLDYYSKFSVNEKQRECRDSFVRMVEKMIASGAGYEIRI